MPDSFEALRLPATPLAPDPQFAARLRSRLAAALRRPLLTSRPRMEGVIVTQLIPYIAVSGARDALSWYQDAFGAETSGSPIVMPDGRIGHAELLLGQQRLMLAEAHPEIGVTAPAGGGNDVTLYLAVDRYDGVDLLIERAVDAGAELTRPAATYEYGRNGVIRDPFGHRWMIAAEPEAAVPADSASSSAPRHGDLGYASLNVAEADASAAADFFASVLGWRYGTAPEAGRSRQVEGQTLSLGIYGTDGTPTLFCAFAVHDLDSALDRVREAGGSAGPVADEHYGRIAECTDNQGVALALYEPPGGGARPAGSQPGPAAHGELPGDLAYVTMHVVDSSKAQAFYGHVLGWSFEPGRVEDGWQVRDPAPMFGIAGGHERARTLPMYRVAGIDAAVAAVRAGGGRSTDPEQQPYGVSAECEWRGVGFYLGEL